MPVHYERRGAAALVTIERQERRNAVDGPTADLLGAAYDRFEADDDARVMVLTGAGDVAFCAGADLKALETLAPRLDDPRGPLGFTRLTPEGMAEAWKKGEAPNHPGLDAMPGLKACLDGLPTPDAAVLKHAAHWVGARFEEEKRRRA